MNIYVVIYDDPKPIGIGDFEILGAVCNPASGKKMINKDFQQKSTNRNPRTQTRYRVEKVALKN